MLLLVVVTEVDITDIYCEQKLQFIDKSIYITSTYISQTITLNKEQINQLLLCYIFWSIEFLGMLTIWHNFLIGSIGWLKRALECKFFIVHLGQPSSAMKLQRYRVVVEYVPAGVRVRRRRRRRGRWTSTARRGCRTTPCGSRSVPPRSASRAGCWAGPGPMSSFGLVF